MIKDSKSGALTGRVLHQGLQTFIFIRTHKYLNNHNSTKYIDIPSLFTPLEIFAPKGSSKGMIGELTHQPKRVAHPKG